MSVVMSVHTYYSIKICLLCDINDDKLLHLHRIRGSLLKVQFICQGHPVGDFRGVRLRFQGCRK